MIQVVTKGLTFEEFLEWYPDGKGRYELHEVIIFMTDLPIIQKTYDLIKWYVPILNRLPRDHKFPLGNRITTGLYEVLERLIVARYTKQKLAQLELLNRSSR